MSVESPTYQPKKETKEKQPPIAGTWKDVKGIELNKNGFPTFLEFFLGNWNEKSNGELEKQQKLLSDVLSRKDIPINLRLTVGIDRNGIGHELLRRKNPEFKSLDDQWREVTNKRAQEFVEWTKNTEKELGHDKVVELTTTSQVPDFYTPEELDLFEKWVQTSTNQGVSVMYSSEDAEKIKEAGGFNKWQRQITKEAMLEQKEALGKMGENSQAKEIIGNINKRLYDEGYE